MKPWTLALGLLAYSLSSQGQPLEGLYPGGIAVVTLPDGTQSAEFKGYPVWIENNQARIGIPLSETAGPNGITIDNGQWIGFTISDRQYPEQHIQLRNTQQVTPNQRNLTRIRGESAEQQAWYRRFSQWQPELPMVFPVKGRVSGEFGRRRVFNGQPRRPHSGIDIAAPTGTPVLAPTSGQVIGVGDYFFNGKTLFIDHGQGLITMFCHLSAIDVSIGDWVEQGSPVAKVGSTGRSTGPHLHWTLSLNDARIEPHLLLPQLSDLPRKK